MRVISGRARGRRLKYPDNEALTRPMKDIIKEALFSSLGSLGVYPERILDLYAGSGSIGIEALSRSGTWADFVDRDRRACQTIRENLRSVGFEEEAAIHQMPIDAFLANVHKPYDFVIVDPPYANLDIIETLASIDDSSAAEDGTIIVLGHWPKLETPDRIGRLELLRRRCHGDSCYSIYDVVGQTGPNEEEA